MSTTAAAPSVSTAKQAQAHVQRFGTFLSGMIMPNIGAFIAWGLITAFFIQTGFTPVAALGGFNNHTGLVGPMITYLLPLLIGYTGGRNMYPEHATRGGVVGAIATMGVIIGAPIPMFIGAMLMGPLTGWTMKKIDGLWAGKIKPGFEMLVDNFSAGIWSAMLAVFAFYIIAKPVDWFTNGASHGVNWLNTHNVLPLTSIIIEPAKVLFLNNAVNHGILTPLGIQQAATQGKSILFLLEANPGPGIGLLLAYMVFGKGAAKASAPGAGLIQFFGGIHEIYFPYVLMKPQLILATILGGMTGITTNKLLGGGLRAPAAPGSIFAVIAQCPPRALPAVLLSVLLAATVSFLVSMVILKASKEEISQSDLESATVAMEALKGKKSSVAGTLVGGGVGTATLAPSRPIRNVVFACDAGMGSSAMGASVLRNKIKDAGYGDVKVTNQSIANLTDIYDVVVTHQDLVTRTAPKVPSATVLTVDNFMASPRFDEVVDMIRAQRSAAAPVAAAAPAAPVSPVPAPAPAPTAAPAALAGDILASDSIVMHGTATDKAGAISESGELLVKRGAVTEGYVNAMHEREASVSTYMGNLLAIPHGTNEAKDFINASAMSFVKYDNPIDWNGKPVKFVIGIAGKNKEHLAILGKIARIFSTGDSVAALELAQTPADVAAILAKVNV